MTLRRVLFDLVRRTGYEIYRWPLVHSFEADLQRVLVMRSIENVVDVGANEGQYGRLLRSLGFRGRIVSVEPGLEAFARLEQGLDDEWEAHRLALGDRQAVGELRSYGNSQLSSLHEASSWGMGHWHLTMQGSETVGVERLDDLMRRLRVAPSKTFVKIDTQGHDAAVVRGGTEFLSRVAGLQLELPTYHLYEHTPHFVETLIEVERLGLAMMGLFPVQRDLIEKLVPVEFDGLFVRPLPALQSSPSGLPGHGADHRTT